MRKAIDQQAAAAAEQAAPAPGGYKIRRLTLSVGEQIVQPAQFHTMKIGGLVAEVELDDDVNVRKVSTEVTRLLEELVDDQFEERLQNYIGRIKRTAAASKRG